MLWIDACAISIARPLVHSVFVSKTLDRNVYICDFSGLFEYVDDKQRTIGMLCIHLWYETRKMCANIFHPSSVLCLTRCNIQHIYKIYVNRRRENSQKQVLVWMQHTKELSKSNRMRKLYAFTFFSRHDVLLQILSALLTLGFLAYCPFRTSRMVAMSKISNSLFWSTQHK